MKHLIKRSLATLLTLALIFGTMPYIALAANDDYVLTSISHADAVDSVNVSDKFDATLTVPYDYPATIDLSKGLDISYSASTYYSAVASFPDGADANIEGDAVKMLVTYQYTETESPFTATYNIYVKRAVPVDSKFSGTINKTVTLPNSLSLSAADFTAKYTPNDGQPLGSIAISGSNPSFGSLQLDGSDYVLGEPISLAELSAGALTFAATASGTRDYTVEAYETDDTSNVAGTAVLRITVSQEVINAANITYTTNADTAIDFNAAGFSDVCTTATGDTLSYVNFTLPSSSYGKLYYNYVSASSPGTQVLASTKYYASADPYLADITFVPYSGYSGTVIISYVGQTAGAKEYNGKVQVTVNASTVAAITYTTDQDTELTFDSADFNDVSNNQTSDNLSYVKFTLPSSTYGILYYDYTSSSTYDSKVSSTTKYYRSSTSSEDLDNVTFVPHSVYTGTVSIKFTGYSTAAESFTGTVKITVGSSSNSSTTTITYTTDQDTELTFDSADFNDVCDNQTSDNLSYVKFTLPSSSYGTLYYDYTSSSNYDSKVTSTTKYYRSSSPDLDDVTFVPKSGYSGTVSIKFTGYSTGSESFTGTVKITVGSSSSSSTTITYTTDEDTKITLDSNDFNDVCDNQTSDNLSYVKFTLPSSSYGTLYYDYTSSSTYDSKVASTTKYYRSSSPDLDDVAFVPYSGYTGTVSIKFTGYSTASESFTGTVKITVKAVADTGSKYFNDVNSSYTWAAPSIDYLYTTGVVTGTSTNIYSPAAKITRGDFMLMLYRALKLSSNSTTTNFPDVPKGSYYYTAISTAKALGIALGSSGYFKPASAITREDAMVLVARAMKVAGKTLSTGSISNLTAFTDKSSVSSYAISAVASLVLENIIKGENGYIYPKSSVTRAEMAVILYRVLQK